jgi:AraC-like DNA-binding protein
VVDDEIQVYGSGAELMYHARGPSRWIAVTVPRAALEEWALQRTGVPLTLPARGIASFKVHRRQRMHLQQLATDAFGLARVMHPHPIGSALAQEISRSFLAAYVDALCAAELANRSARAATARRHYHLIRACEQLVLTAGMVNVDLSTIARRSGYSLRALELIFRRGVGMPPGRWFTNVRLNGALRDLIAPTADCTVTAVATRWGFVHLSRFAEQYRKAFGESPNQTLKRARAR